VEMLDLFRWANLIVFGIGAYLAWRRWNVSQYQPWQVVGILATIIAAYFLIAAVIYTFDLPLEDEMQDVSALAANIAYLLGGLAIVYAATYEKRSL
jgi:hypothetical protein